MNRHAQPRYQVAIFLLLSSVALYGLTAVGQTPTGDVRPARGVGTAAHSQTPTYQTLSGPVAVPRGAPSFTGILTGLPVVQHSFEYRNLEQQILSLVQEHAKAKDENECSRLRKKIIGLTGKQFDIRQQSRQREIERLEKQLQKVETKVERQKELREKIIDKRVTDLLNEDELAWGSVTERASNRLAYPGVTTQRSLGGYPASGPTEPTYKELKSFYGKPSALNGQRSSSLADESAILSNDISIAEAKVQVEIAEKQLERVRSLASSNAASQSELGKVEDAAKLARLRLDRVKREYDGRTRLLQLDLRKTEAELQLAQEERAEVTQAYKQGVVGSADLRRVQSTLKEKEFENEKAKTLLDLHLSGAAREETSK